MGLRGRPVSARLVLGQTRAWRWPLPFGSRRLALEGAEIHQHRWVQGLTGQGKSKLLASIFVQLHGQGIACGLIDPHGDLARDCLGLLHTQGVLSDDASRRRLLYIDFSCPDAFLPFNWLQQAANPHAVARNLVEVCTRVWPSLADGLAPTFENILLHATVVLVENGYPLTVLERLLVDKSFRDMSLQNVDDHLVRNFFHERYDKWGRQGILMRESTLNRIALLTFSPALRYSLGQQDSVLNFQQHMDEGISVIYNLGGLDEETQRFLGALLLVGYESAALSRARLAPEVRRPWHLIVDEFSLFSARSEETLTQVLETARKFGLFFTLAHQTWSQLSGRLQGALQNTQSITFKLGRSDAEWAAKRLGHFESQAVKHAVADPAQADRVHPLYYSVPETFERWTQALQELGPREAYVKHGNQAVKIRTIEVPPVSTDSSGFQDLLRDYDVRMLRPAHQVKSQVDRQVGPTETGAQPTRRVALV